MSNLDSDELGKAKNRVSAACATLAGNIDLGLVDTDLSVPLIVLMQILVLTIAGSRYKPHPGTRLLSETHSAWS